MKISYVKLLFIPFLITGLVTSCLKKEDLAPESESYKFEYSKYYSEKPNLENCYPGKINEFTKNEVLNYNNYVRSLHFLPPVYYEEAFDDNVQYSALLTVANNIQTHQPKEHFLCFTPKGESGSKKSNLNSLSSDKEYDYENTKAINSLLTELHNAVETVGHRRWILYPFLKYISFGRVDGWSKDGSNKFVNASALKVINDDYADISNINIDYVAYPYNNYPSNLFTKDCFLSFSVLADKNNKSNNLNVVFSKAFVEVKTNNNTIGINSITYDNTGYGLPNSIQWKLNSFEENKEYTIKILNVIVNGTPKNYEYSFKMTK